MGPDAASRTVVPGYAGRPTTKAPNWHDLVVLDLLFNNLSTGLFVVMAVGEILAPESFRPLAPVAYPLALVFLIGDLICLIFDLGDPLRFHHMLRVWKPSSPMSLGTWVLTAYSAPLTVLALLSVVPGGTELETLRIVLLVPGLVLAIAAAVYKGVLFSTTAQGGWGEARWLGGYLINSAMALGAAEVLVLALLLGQPEASAPLQDAVRLLLALNLLVLGLLVANIRGALVRARGLGRLAVTGTIAVVIGVLVPLWLLGSAASWQVWVALACVLVGASVVRLEIVRLPHLLGHARSGG